MPGGEFCESINYFMFILIIPYYLLFISELPRKSFFIPISGNKNIAEK